MGECSARVEQRGRYVEPTLPTCGRRSLVGHQLGASPAPRSTSERSPSEPEADARAAVLLRARDRLTVCLLTCAQGLLCVGDMAQDLAYLEEAFFLAFLTYSFRSSLQASTSFYLPPYFNFFLLH